MKLRAACLALILGVLTACGGGGGGGDAPPPAPPPATGTVTGVVTATLTGAPVAGAVVRAGTLSATAGSDGRFTLANVPPNARTVLRFEAAGYAPLFETAEVVASRSASVSASLTPVGVSQTVSSAAANVVVVPNSTARVSLPANGFVNAATNAPVSG
ncbi:MAG: carboxypeptidase-like regulatory domain-containing protein, partial [Burkholderiaceae bacterium]|nr:carboxypeptidase-like regulatory domain-containing protein [Burkholderiaceae bacterium]